MERLLGDVSEPLQSDVAVKMYDAVVQFGIYFQRFGHGVFQDLSECWTSWNKFDATREIPKYREGTLQRLLIPIVLTLLKIKSSKRGSLPTPKVTLWH